MSAYAQVYSTVHIIPAEFGRDRKEIEANLVAELARKVHRDGREWERWPKIEEHPEPAPFPGVRLVASVVAVPS